MELMAPVDGGEVWAEDTGGHGLPLVLLHPGVGDSAFWDPILPRLTQRHRVIRYDARGYGRSPKPTTAFSLAGDLTAVLDHFALDRAVLAGSSMGGSAALNVALDSPARIAGLALVGPGVTGYEGLVSPDLMARIEVLAKAGDMDGLIAFSLRTWGALGKDGDPQAVAQLRSAIPAWFSNFLLLTRDAPAFDRLGELRVPCVLALGEHDQPEVVRCNEEMAERIPGCRLVRLTESDHYAPLREPEKVADLIMELCAGLT
ncbi:alpha/beta fold hydrolase [Streptomyces sp. NPDC020799]|uniref:alpha/beta fold hydrolase n=1 Tax=Streptomyces sp. NPDC020799 TaxID=3365091 RepID=UPI00378A3962